MTIYEVEGTYIVNPSSTTTLGNYSVQHYILRVNSDDLYRITQETISRVLQLEPDETNSVRVTKIRKLSEEEAYVLELNHITIVELK